jgi:hypothetical protein
MQMPSLVSSTIAKAEISEDGKLGNRIVVGAAFIGAGFQVQLLRFLLLDVS